MALVDRIFQLQEIFQNRRYGVSVRDLADQLECSIPTVKRHIKKLRDEFGFPVHYDFKHQGYVLNRKNEEAFELPGLWFNISELHSLITIHELIDKMDPGLLKAELTPLRTRIEKILAVRGAKVNDLAKRIHFIGVGIRMCCPATFRVVVTASMERKRLKLRYHSRSEDKISSRNASPQRLIYYRGNWYLAAYCHTRRALRTLALDRMNEVVPLDTDCLEIQETDLMTYFTTSFGIFAGAPKQEAVLRFTKESARWVADEKWHPDQKSQWLEDGSFELRLPYSDQRELVMEVMRYGPEVRVESPPELRQAVQQRLELALGLYEKK